MSARLSELLSHVSVGQPQTADGLQVFGLRWETGAGPDYRTLDEALEAKTIEVTELSEAGSVPQLKVVNRGDSAVFLMSGELLVGAKQNRVLNASLLVAPNREMPVPVSCIESGRWRYESRTFSSSKTMSHTSLRKMMSMDTAASYRTQGSPTSNQSKVWGEVSRKLEKVKSHSPSSALTQAFADHGQRMDELLTRLTAPAGCAGVAFARNGKVSSVDLFDRPETLAKLWPKLLRGQALDALEETEGTTELSVTDVETWVHSAGTAAVERFPSPGLGSDVRLSSASTAGACLVVDEHPIHAELYPRDAETPAG